MIFDTALNDWEQHVRVILSSQKHSKKIPLEGHGQKTIDPHM
jgi:hypothetical protein